MEIRRAETKDINGILALLHEVLEIHAALRPDIFISGTTKYTPEELEDLLADDTKPIFVADDGGITGYAFCVLKEESGTNIRECRELYIDDLCVSGENRGKGVGSKLYEYVKNYSKNIGCRSLTLNVWEGNDSARAFYERGGLFVRKTQLEEILK